MPIFALLPIVCVSEKLDYPWKGVFWQVKASSHGLTLDNAHYHIHLRFVRKILVSFFLGTRILIVLKIKVKCCIPGTFFGVIILTSHHGCDEVINIVLDGCVNTTWHITLVSFANCHVQSEILISTGLSFFIL